MQSLIHLKSLVGKVADSLMEDSTILTHTYSSVFEDNYEGHILATVPTMTSCSRLIAVSYHFIHKCHPNSTVKIFMVASDKTKVKPFIKCFEHLKFQSLWILLMG